MVHFNAQKQWWLVISTIVVVGIAVLLISEQWLPQHKPIGFIGALGLVGAGFYWVYSIDREHLWWAVIPGLSAFTLAAAALADQLIGTDPQNDWSSVLVIGFGTAIIAAVLKRRDAKQVLIVVSVISLLVGILMAPIAAALKIGLVAVDLLVGVQASRANRW